MSDLNLQINKERLESTMERTFDAPRELVFRAHTEKDLIGQWWGPRKYKINVETYEFNTGGKWRIAHEADGERHVFYGEFREIKEPELITWTFNYEPYPNSEVVETMHFEEMSDRKSKLTVVSRFPSLEALEGMAASGMEEGARETWERLEEVVEKMKNG